MTLNFENISDSKVYIYGTGSFGMEIFKICNSLNLKVESFIDHIVKPDFTFKKLIQVNELPESEEIVVLLGICNLFGDIRTISSQLLAKNPKAIIITPVTIAKMCFSKGLFLDNYWLTGDTSYIEKNNHKILLLKELLSDQKSQELVDDIIKFRLNGNVFDVPKPENLLTQYLPPDLLTPPNALRMLELGAYKGEDIIRFASSGKVFDIAFCLEPDLENYKSLVSNIYNSGIPNVYCMPAGAWKETVQLKFEASGQTGAQLNDSAENSVLVLQLDNLVGSNSINYIKMDIEGAEADAIEGLSKTIEIHKPHLAVSIYHKPEDLWGLPLKVEKIVPNIYDFYIRVYGHQTFDTVLYCIPKI